MAPKKARGKRNIKKRAASVAYLDKAPTSDVQSQDDTAESPGTAETDIDNTDKPGDADECTESESVKRKQRKVRDRLNLSQEQEEDLANWLQDNPMLYNKGSRDYKDTEKKKKLWEDKAKELDMTGKY